MIFPGYSNAKMNATSGKSSKNHLRKCHGLLCLHMWFPRYRCLKIGKNCWLSNFSIFSWFSNVNILGTTYGNIANHNIFLNGFSSSFHWWHSFLHLSNQKKSFFGLWSLWGVKFTLTPKKHCSTRWIFSDFFCNLSMLIQTRNNQPF